VDRPRPVARARGCRRCSTNKSQARSSTSQSRLPELLVAIRPSSLSRSSDRWELPTKSPRASLSVARSAARSREPPRQRSEKRREREFEDLVVERSGFQRLRDLLPRGALMRTRARRSAPHCGCSGNTYTSDLDSPIRSRTASGPQTKRAPVRESESRRPTLVLPPKASCTATKRSPRGSIPKTR